MKRTKKRARRARRRQRGDFGASCLQWIIAGIGLLYALGSAV